MLEGEEAAEVVEGGGCVWICRGGGLSVFTYRYTYCVRSVRWRVGVGALAAEDDEGMHV